MLTRTRLNVMFIRTLLLLLHDQDSQSVRPFSTITRFGISKCFLKITVILYDLAHYYDPVKVCLAESFPVCLT
jgi:hypothetical protein